MSKLLDSLAQYWFNVQHQLFPFLEEEIGPLTEKQLQLIAVLDFVRIEQYLPDRYGCEGRPAKTRAAIARSFVVKMFYNMDTTRALYERLQSDKNLRRICGWETRRHIPSESTFSRAFVEFAEIKLPSRVHEALIKKTFAEHNEIVMHNSRDATAIVAREKPTVKKAANEDTNATKPQKKRGRPKKGEKRPPKEPTRLEKQRSMTLEEMLEDLPNCCDIGAKKNSKGHSEHWIGYKLHIDFADGCIPLSALLTSASVHDSQAALPLAKITAKRVHNFYDLMDAAYDSPIILEHSKSLGHVPLIDKNTRRDKALAEEMNREANRLKLLNFEMPETVRYKKRTNSERGNSRLKDTFGGKTVRVRGFTKVLCHLMFGLLTLAADQILKLII
jgi:transposase